MPHSGKKTPWAGQCSRSEKEVDDVMQDRGKPARADKDKMVETGTLVPIAR